MTLTNELISQFNTIFNGDPWYGKSIHAILHEHEVLPAEVANICFHMLAWRQYALKILNHQLFKIELNSPADWPVPDTFWSSAVISLFETSNTQLIAAIARANHSDWDTPVGASDYSMAQIIKGVIDHDIYHLGQIALLLKGA